MRKKRKFKKTYLPDAYYNNVNLGRFINYIIKKGKKNLAEKIMYQAMDIIKEKTKQEPLEIFDLALKNATPLLEVRPRRIGGANYQVPQQVRPARQFMLTCRWILGAARKKRGKSMAEKLAEELIAASKNEGAAIKKKEDTHKVAQANRAFAHFAW